MSPESTATRLIQFAKCPEPGRVKTRMIPHLSAAQACELHLELLHWTLGTLVTSGLGPVQVAIAGDPSHAEVRALRAIVEVSQQQGTDLGQRMHAALRDALRRSSKVLLVGSDCPALTADYLQQAQAALEQTPVVLGPALDGGYVLIGATRITAQVFEGVDWGSECVMSQTRDNLRSAGLAWTELAPLPDIDRPEDLPLWYQLRHQLRHQPRDRRSR
mgnify:CR=1 FL=1